MPRRECVLYITDDCVLCDEALDMLLKANVLRGIVLTTIDVAEDDALFNSYGEHIPVLEYLGETLNWPFSVEEAVALFSPK